MLRPEQMSKISVTGSKSVMDEVIETMHAMHMVDITDYDGSWEGFEPGDPLPGSDETSSTLVTVRAIESILGVTEDDVGTDAAPDLSNAEERLEEVRTAVNDLDETRDEIRGELRDIEERLERMEQFADLGLDLDLLWGYDSLDVLVGEGDAAEIRAGLEESEAVAEFDVFTGTDSVAIYAYLPTEGDLSDALVGVPFTAYEVPEETGDPEANVERLNSERKRLEAKLEKIKSELEALKADAGAFLLALEEELSIEAEKSEAPLRFATTERSFVVEGWVPGDSCEEFEEQLRAQVGERLEIDEIQRASYTSGGHVAHDDVHDAEHGEEGDSGHGDGSPGGVGAEGEAATDGGRQPAAAADSGDGQTQSDDEDTPPVATDGGGESGLVTVADDPPVIQKNSRVVNPFEVLVKAVNRPKYSEFDPTILLFLTFPFFFGFMIGDIGYGTMYVLIGYFVYSRFESQSVRDFGLVVVWLGLFTFVFGFLYGEVFGLHFLEWFDIHPVLEKGITAEEWAQTWLVAAVIFGWVQLNLGYILNFIEELQLHGAKEAIIETGSWLLMLNGAWVFIFSMIGEGSKPAFLVGEEAVLASGSHTIPLGFTGFPEIAGFLGLAAFAVGIILILIGPWYEVFEFLVPVVHVLSYTRLTAVLLSKAGMALAANLLYFGAYRDEEGFHFLHTTTPGHKEGKEIVFGGLSNMGTHIDIGPLTVGIEGALLGLPVLIIAHLVVLAIGGTAGLQAIRLEYVEFFEKFYEGGGKNYQPFGYERTYTTDA